MSRPRHGSHPFTRRALKAARRAGWRVNASRHGWVLFAPDGVTRITLHTSESESGKVVCASRLKAAGVVVTL